MNAAPAPFEQAHAFGAARHEHRLGLEPPLQPPAHRGEARLVDDAPALGPARLVLVRGQDAHAPIGVDVAVLGIHAHRELEPPRDPERGVERARVDHALAVIAHDQALAARQLAFQRPHHAGQGFAADVGARLAVGAHDLLGVGDDAGLDRGRPGGILDQRGQLDVPALELPAQRAARLVGAGDSEQHRPAAERAEVRDHVSRSAERGRFTLDLDHRHRRLRRNPLDAPPHVAVEHHVSQHRDPAAGETIDDRGEPIAIEAR